MKKDKNNEELQSRREFFKKAAKGVLPILGIIAFGPTILMSCGDDDVEYPPTPNPYSSKGDGTFMSPYSPSEAYKVASQLADGEMTDEVIINGRVNSITYNYSIEEGTATFYLSDLGTTGDTLLVYRAYYLHNTPYNYGALLNTGDEVLLIGKLTKYNGTPEVANRSGYLHLLNGHYSPSSTCTDCSAVCSANCSGECTSSCTGACGSSCTGSCSGSCENACKGSCTGGCGSSCTGSCSGGCSTTCTGNCVGGCSGGCSSGCTGQCGSTCTAECRSSCTTSCSVLCDTTCKGGCDTTCYAGCLQTCKGACYGTSYRYG